MSRQTLVVVASSLIFAALSLCLVSARAADARFNRMIELWEQGKPAIGAFARFRDGDAAIYPEEEMIAYPVSTRVNTPKNDDSALIEPLPQKN